MSNRQKLRTLLQCQHWTCRFSSEGPKGKSEVWVTNIKGGRKPVIRVFSKHSQQSSPEDVMLCSMISVETIETRMYLAVAADRGLSIIPNKVCKLHTRLRSCGFPSICPKKRRRVRRVQNDSDRDAPPFWLKPFWLKPVSFVFFVRRSVMPRKGWSSLESPTGWYQVIRGPRPKAVQWPQQQWQSSFSWRQQSGQWPVLTSQTRATEMATWAGHTGHQSRGGFGSGTHEGAAVGKRQRSFGRQRVSRSPVVGSSTRGSPPSSPGAACGDSSRRMSSFHPLFSQSSDADGAGAGRKTEGVEHLPRAHAACRHASAISNIGRSSPIASSSRRDGGGERRILSVPSPDMPGASEQSVALFQRPERDRSALIATLID